MMNKRLFYGYTIYHHLNARNYNEINRIYAAILEITAIISQKMENGKRHEIK